MIKYSLVALLLLLTPVTVLAASCGEGSVSKTEFLNKVSTEYKVFTLTPSAQERFIAYINPIRIKNGVKPLGLDAQFYFASADVNSTGVVWFEKECVVVGSVILLPSAGLAKAMQLAGLEVEDFIEYKKGVDL